MKRDVKLEVSPLKKKKSAKKEAVTLSLDGQTQTAGQEEQATPAKEAPGQKKKQNKTDVVEYDKAFGKHTKLRYSATLSGFKEDLILDENIGVNEFSFRVQTNGLSLLKEGEAYYFADPLTGEQVSRVSDILVYDGKDLSAVAEKAKANPEETVSPLAYDHHYVLETVEEDQEYILTMVIDEEFLNDPETVYPVTIDPSFWIEGSRNSDTTIYTNYFKPDWTNGSMFAGNYNKRFPQYDRGTARALIRVPYLFNDVFNGLNTEQINSVKLNLCDKYPGDPQNTINVYMMNEFWYDLAAVCSDKLWDGYDRNLVSSRVFKWGNADYVDDHNVHHYMVDITKAAKAWKNGRTDNGLMLKAANENIAARVFRTVEGNYPLHLEVSYGYRVKINQSNFQLEIGKTSQLTAAVTPDTGVGVTWSSSNPAVVSITSGGLLTAKSPGITQITAASIFDSSDKATISVSVIDPDPFAPSNIESIRIKKYDAEKLGGSKDISTSVIQLKNGLGTYCEIIAPDCTFLSYHINDELKDLLWEKYNLYRASCDVTPEAFCYYKAKLDADQYVSLGWIEDKSPEYYGIWATDTKAQLEYKNLTHQAINAALATATVAYCIFNSVSAIRSSKLAVNESASLSGNQYKQAVSELDDVTKQMTHNPNSNRMMLGTSTPDRTWHGEAQKNGMTYFYTSNYDKDVAKYGKNGFHSFNYRYVHEQLRTGKEVWFSHDSAVQMKDFQNTDFAMELRWIMHYYGFDKFMINKNYEKVGDYWRLINVQ